MGKYHSNPLMPFDLAFQIKCKYTEILKDLGTTEKLTIKDNWSGTYIGNVTV